MFVSLSAFAEEAAAKIIKAEGTVTAESDSCDSRALARGADVFAKDSVKTAADSFATLRFSDGTVIDLAASSSMKIRDYAFNDAKPEGDKFSSELLQGGFRAITGTIGKRSPSEFTSKARLTTLTVRGTGFAAGVTGVAPVACGPVQTQGSPLDNVTISVLLDSVDVKLNNMKYPLMAGSNAQTFDLTRGKVSVLKPVADFKGRGYVFQGTMNDFVKSVKALPPLTPATTAPVVSNEPPAPAGATGGGAASQSPCGTLNAVEGALPPSSKP
uniref:FecR protein domain-containing protein n=1 Tax=uncultured microorganism TaxID=358574 RepID=F8UGY8_9ZZZZ|nr:hypothetical protein LDC_03699 [uncultured microorganism]